MNMLKNFFGAESAKAKARATKEIGKMVDEAERGYTRAEEQIDKYKGRATDNEDLKVLREKAREEAPSERYDWEDAIDRYLTDAVDYEREGVERAMDNSATGRAGIYQGEQREGQINRAERLGSALSWGTGLNAAKAQLEAERADYNNKLNAYKTLAGTSSTVNENAMKMAFDNANNLTNNNVNAHATEAAHEFALSQTPSTFEMLLGAVANAANTYTTRHPGQFKDPAQSAPTGSDYSKPGRMF